MLSLTGGVFCLHDAHGVSVGNAPWLVGNKQECGRFSAQDPQQSWSWQLPTLVLAVAMMLPRFTCDALGGRLSPEALP